MFRCCRYSVLLKYISFSGGCGRYGCYIGSREFGPIVPSFRSKNLSAKTLLKDTSAFFKGRGKH